MKNTCFLDIQTTGLFWRTSTITYLGLRIIENDTTISHDFFVNGEEEEYLVLTKLNTLFKNITTLYTYNGNTFDLPYLNHKLHAYGIEPLLTNLTHIDLMRVIAPYKNFLQLLSLKQQDVELFLGYKRNNQGLDADLNGMLSLVKLFSFVENITNPFLDIKVYTEEDEKSQELYITCKCKHVLSFAYSINLPPYYIWIKDDILKLKVTLFKGTYKLFFSNYKDYYYLHAEDQAIHKSVATYVDKEYRTKAKASTCYQKIHGTYLPQPNTRFKPALQDDYNAKSYYLPLPSFLTMTKQEQEAYVKEVLQFARDYSPK